MKTTSALGRHLLVELYGCDLKLISDLEAIEKIMIGAAKAAKAHVVDTVFHHFNPHGISGVVVIKESHLAIHTWPEHRFASIDVYTCGKTIDPWKAHKFLTKRFRPKYATAIEMKRGMALG